MNRSHDYGPEAFRPAPAPPADRRTTETPATAVNRRALLRLRRDAGAMAALGCLMLITLLALIVPALSGYPYTAQNPGAINLPARIPGLEGLGILDGARLLEGRREDGLSDTSRYPEGTILEIRNPRTVQGIALVDVVVDAYAMAGLEGQYHWLGTDYLGRDAMTRLFRGARVSLLIAALSVTGCTLIGTAYGAVAGYFGGRTDFILMRVAEVVSALPQLVVMTLLILVLGTGLHAIVLAIMLRGWVPAARLVRARVYQLREEEYVLAARTLGAGNRRIVMRHILPSVAGPVLTQAMLAVPGAIFSEAFLAYIGLGLQAPEPSLGVLLADGQRTLLQYPWQLLCPALLLSVMMIAINRLADGIRDAWEAGALR